MRERLDRTVLSALAVALLAAVMLGGCQAGEEPDPAPPPPPPAADPAPADPDADTSLPDVSAPSAIAWLDTELVDVITGETFRISDFAGRPVLVKSFAVW